MPRYQRLLQPWSTEVQLLLGLVPDTAVVHVILAWCRALKVRDEVEMAVSQMQEQEICATKAPGSAHSLLRQTMWATIGKAAGEAAQDLWMAQHSSRCWTWDYRTLLVSGFRSSCSIPSCHFSILPFWSEDVYPESLYMLGVFNWLFTGAHSWEFNGPGETWQCCYPYCLLRLETSHGLSRFV